MGIRYFTTQLHIEDGEIRQCHTDCALLDVGPFSDILVSLKTWLDAHPREVVTLLVGNGDDNILIEEFEPVFESTGADQIVFTPSERMGLADWPTIGEIIDGGRRLIVFMGKLTGHSPGILHTIDSFDLRLQCRYLQGSLHPPSIW